jgi:uncharacterized cupin superfamily protein
VVPESPLEQTETEAVPAREGWFVLNARDARWYDCGSRLVYCAFEGEPDFEQVGATLFVLVPGHAMSMYHWEADQEDFLVLGGEALLIVEGEERPLRRWDFFHCPVGTKHVIVGAGNAPCVVLAVGGREHQVDADWGGYVVDETALRHGAGVEEETTAPAQAYARFPKREPVPYRQGWLPG